MNEITTSQGGFVLAPANLPEAMKVAEMLAKSELVPKQYQGSPSNILVAMAWGGEVGLKPLQALQNIAVINGRASIWGDAALALCSSRQDFEDIQEYIEGEGLGDDVTAVCVVKRRGRSPVTGRFSVADAKKANLWQSQAKVTRNGKNGGTYQADNDSPWWRYPKRMLQMRARGFALRDAYPDALRGFHLREEVEEIEVNPDFAGRPSVAMPTASSVVVEAATAPAVASEPMPEAEEPATTPASPLAEFIPAQDGDEPKLKPGMLQLIRAKLGGSQEREAALAEAFGVSVIEQIPISQANDAIAWTKQNG